MSTLVQCELCDIFVDFDEYLNHVRNCSENNSALTSSISSFLTYSISSYNSNDTNDVNDSNTEQESYNEESDNETISYNVPIVNNNGNIISAVINLQNLNLRNIYDTDEHNNPLYNIYSNLEDVRIPVKNIDEVAPIITTSEILEGTTCTICQELVKSPVRKTLCNHFFCTVCIEPWLNEMNKTCPNCLCDLEEIKNNNDNNDNNDNNNSNKINKKKNNNKTKRN